MHGSFFAAVIALVCLSISCEAQNANIDAFRGKNIFESFRAAGAINQHNEEAAQGIHTYTGKIGPFSHKTKENFIAYASSGRPKAPRSPELLAIRERMPIHSAPSPEALLLGASPVVSASTGSIVYSLVTTYYSDSACTTPAVNNVETTDMCQYDSSFHKWVIKSYDPEPPGPAAEVVYIHIRLFSDALCTPSYTTSSVTQQLQQCTPDPVGSGSTMITLIAAVGGTAIGPMLSNPVSQIYYSTSGACQSLDATKIAEVRYISSGVCIKGQWIGLPSGFSIKYTCPSSGAAAVTFYTESGTCEGANTSDVPSECISDLPFGFVTDTCVNTGPTPVPGPAPAPGPAPTPFPANLGSIVDSLVRTYYSDDACTTPVVNKVQTMGLCEYDISVGTYVIKFHGPIPPGPGVSVAIYTYKYAHTDSSCKSMPTPSSVYETLRQCSLDSSTGLYTMSTIVAAVQGTAAGPTVSNPISEITYSAPGACRSKDSTKITKAIFYSAGVCIPSELTDGGQSTSTKFECSSSGTASVTFYSDSMCLTPQGTNPNDLPSGCTDDLSFGFVMDTCANTGPTPAPPPTPTPVPANTHSIVDSLFRTYYFDSACVTPVYDNVETMGLCQYDLYANAYVIKFHSPIPPGSGVSVDLYTYEYTDNLCTSNPTAIYYDTSNSQYSETLQQCMPNPGGSGSFMTTIVAAVGGKAAESTVSNPAGQITYMTPDACQSQDATKITNAIFISSGVCIPGELIGEDSGSYIKVTAPCTSSAALSIAYFSDAECKTSTSAFDLPPGCVGNSYSGFSSGTCANPPPPTVPANTGSIIDSLVTTAFSDSACATPVYNEVMTMGLCQYDSSASAYVVKFHGPVPAGPAAASVNIYTNTYTDSSCTSTPVLPVLHDGYTQQLKQCTSLGSGSIMSNIVAGVAASTLSNPVSEIYYSAHDICQSQDATKITKVSFYSTGVCIPAVFDGEFSGNYMKVAAPCTSSAIISIDFFIDDTCQTLAGTSDVPPGCNGQPMGMPSTQLSGQPLGGPFVEPSSQPTGVPSGKPSRHTDGLPSSQPTGVPSSKPSGHPPGDYFSATCAQPSGQPSAQPTGNPTQPTGQPSTQPSAQPTSQPSAVPSLQPSAKPSAQPSNQPSARPSAQPTSKPTGKPNASAAATTSSKGSSSSTGAIAGGVVGAIAVVAIVVFYMKHQSKMTAIAAAAAATTGVDKIPASTSNPMNPGV